MEKDNQQKLKEESNNKMEIDVENEEDDEDFDLEALQKEAKENMEVEYIDEDPLANYDFVIEQMKEEDLKEGESQTNNTLEEELLKDEDIKKMAERKLLLTINEFPDFEADGEIYSIDLYDKKGLLLFGDGEENYYLYNVLEKKVIKKEKLQKDSIISCKFSFDYAYFITASMDGTVYVYNTESLELIHKIEDSDEEVMVSSKLNSFLFLSISIVD